MLTAAGTLVAAPEADAAAQFYWQDSDPGYYRPAPMAQPRKPKPRRPSAKTAVSTGMKGHSTPMGVFSVIQKHKLHHSNIYSNAPMPYMQRITWSGVAMHAGVLPGYPASHGCIRMPMAFALKMWNWTRMGARVVITPGEMTPARFSHPLLAEKKLAPQPIAAADEPKPDAAAKTDKCANAGGAVRPSISAASLDLRSTVGH